MRNIVFIGMACVLLSACGVDPAERVYVVDSVDTSDGDSPVDTSDGLPVEGTTVPRVVQPRLTRSGATASKLTPNDEGNRVQEAQAAQGASRRIPPSPADGQKGATVPGNGGASVPAVSVADSTVIARDESMKVVRFRGLDLSNRDCQLLTSDLTLRSNGTAIFATRILAVGINITYNFSFGYYDNQWNIIFTTPNLSHRLSEKYPIDEAKHEITFDMSEFEKVEHVKITFNCEKEGSDNPSANASSGATALTPKGEGNRTQDASQGLPARTLARSPQPSPPEPSSPEPSAPVVRPVAAARVDSTPSEPKLIDINTASADDLNRLGERFGKAIIAGRPYRSVHELVSKRVLKRSTFSRIKDRITVNTAEQPTAAPKASVVQALNARSETRRRQ